MEDNDIEHGNLEVFRNIYKDLEHIYDQFPKMCGLSGTEYWALSMIYQGIDTQHGICEQLSISRQTVNSAFKQLKKRGFIDLKTNDDNLRVKHVYLTDVGEKFVKKEITNMHLLERKVWNAMDLNERIEISKHLYKYKELLSKALDNYKENMK